METDYEYLHRLPIIYSYIHVVVFLVSCHQQQRYTIEININFFQNSCYTGLCESKSNGKWTLKITQLEATLQLGD